MNKLEEAAREHADGFERVDPGQDESIQSARIVGFKRGAEWQAKQSPWISVEERKPEYGESVFFIVQWTNHKEYLSGVYCVDGSMESGNRIFPQDSTLGSFTHWMPIPE